MSTFDEREKGFEAKYKHDQEIQFKVTARRNRLWACGRPSSSGYPGRRSTLTPRLSLSPTSKSPATRTWSAR